MIGRKCLAIESHPQYVDLAIRRWQTCTGKVAMLGDKSFAQIEAERA
jgi:DNA modification methylase